MRHGDPATFIEKSNLDYMIPTGHAIAVSFLTSALLSSLLLLSMLIASIVLVVVLCAKKCHEIAINPNLEKGRKTAMKRGAAHAKHGPLLPCSIYSKGAIKRVR